VDDCAGSFQSLAKKAFKSHGFSDSNPLPYPEIRGIPG